MTTPKDTAGCSAATACSCAVHERQWFQIALKTYFWTGAVNAVFCCIAIGALIEVKRLKEDAITIGRQNVKDMAAWEAYRRDARDFSRQADFSWYKVQEAMKALEAAE